MCDTVLTRLWVDLWFCAISESSTCKFNTINSYLSLQMQNGTDLTIHINHNKTWLSWGTLQILPEGSSLWRCDTHDIICRLPSLRASIFTSRAWNVASPHETGVWLAPFPLYLAQTMEMMGLSWLKISSLLVKGTGLSVALSYLLEHGNQWAGLAF